MAKHYQEGPLRKRLCLLVLTVSLIMGALASTAAGAGNSEQAAEAHNSIESPVEIYETVSDNGFVHPGVGLTKSILENVRTQVLSQQEPWYSYYKEMSSSPSASKTVISSNQSAAYPTRPNTDAFNSQGVQALFKADATKAYTQALMYIITGDETYRANAMHIIRIWSQMDPAKYAPYPDTFFSEMFGWRVLFILIGVLSVLPLLIIYKKVPAIKEEEKVTLRMQLSMLRNSTLLTALVITLFYISGYSTLFTYITPFLQATSSLSITEISGVLFLAGICSFVGSRVGGQLADAKGSKVTICLGLLL
ncbi:Purine efflux pump PbuE [compost metagenome]